MPLIISDYHNFTHFYAGIGHKLQTNEFFHLWFVFSTFHSWLDMAYLQLDLFALFLIPPNLTYMESL